MDLMYRLAGKREYLSEGEKMEDFKKRTAKMQRIMKKREAEIRDFIYEMMSNLEEDHKTIFTVEERGLVEIPQFVGFLTWPDQKVTTVKTAFYCEEIASVTVDAVCRDLEAQYRYHCRNSSERDENFAWNYSRLTEDEVLEIVVKTKISDERERMKEALRNTPEGEKLTNKEIHFRVIGSFNTHRTAKDCPGSDCAVCAKARETCSWPHDTPFLSLSYFRNSRTKRNSLIKHYKLKEKELWKAKSYGSDSGTTPEANEQACNTEVPGVADGEQPCADVERVRQDVGGTLVQKIMA